MPKIGYKATEEHRKKNSEAIRKKWLDKEYREEQIKRHKEYKFTDEHRKNMSISQRGTKKPWAGKGIKSEEHRKHLSEAHKGMKKPWAGMYQFKGGKATERVRRTFN
jgi:hypothetical protein